MLLLVLLVLLVVLVPLLLVPLLLVLVLVSVQELLPPCSGLTLATTGRLWPLSLLLLIF